MATASGFTVYGPPSQVTGQVDLWLATNRALIAGHAGHDYVYPKEGDYAVSVVSESKVVRLLPRVFSSLSQSSLVATTERLSILEVELTPSLIITPNPSRLSAEGESLLVLEVLTYDESGNTLSLPDLGTGLKHDSLVECHCK